MADLNIYTEDEIKCEIKTINNKINKGLSQSNLDTGQSEHEFRLNQKYLKEQRDYWTAMLRAKTGNDGGIVQLNILG